MNQPGVTIEARPGPWARFLIPAGLGAAFLWAAWPTLCRLAARWSEDPRYSHGYLVPPFALFLLWLRRGSLATNPLRPSGWGIPVLLLGSALQLTGAIVYFGWLEGLSLLVWLVGLCVLLGGWGGLRWAWPSIAFLVFMLPLPYRLEVALAEPLQRLAAGASAFALQTLGLPALTEGSTILLDDVTIGVVEACNGLGMLVSFLALSTAVALVSRCPWPDKCALALSALPIALLANVIRITATGLLHETAGHKIANMVFHDLAGWLMMPLALGLLGIEFALLPHLLIARTPAGTVPIGRPSRRKAAPHADGFDGSQRRTPDAGDPERADPEACR